MSDNGRNINRAIAAVRSRRNREIGSGNDEPPVGSRSSGNAMFDENGNFIGGQE